ncbi:MAG TPA: phosphoadenylyl-sulfate reductase [Bradyrhizobium sp.]|uniref:phosphoadenylyl-sulfate reductase n=1 Tax=Bradyrhizobium sp. TaxID=376 RepID=UPI002D7E3B6D|nr:phosphoadenylyl-sulfate reductase [Bradyrhizobium sp.]HET7887918.1 phosphoadenylyl-sulfate reductase [Bradyrhizobium sp.]
MSSVAEQIPVETAVTEKATALDEVLRNASPSEVIESALRVVGREHLALVSSFGTESAALLKVMADVDPAIPVIFLDTGWLFEETLAYRDTLIARLGLRDVRSIKPLGDALNREDRDRELWFSDPDACCRIRKVEPLKRALAPFRAWINGRKRFQGGLRADIAVVEADGARLKFNPFANITRAGIEAIYAQADLPPHPLVAAGFLSVGCMPCSSRAQSGEDARDGRWRGRSKTECGIHTG